MAPEMDMIKRSAEHIRSVQKSSPVIAVILGSGLGSLADSIEGGIVIPYGDIPGFPVSTAPGHEGKLISGRLEGKEVLAMKGRFHYYEGYEMSKVIFPIRPFKSMGINDIIITNAAGGINTGFTPGDLMLITDHLGYWCPSPLRGENLAELGARFPDMTQCYDHGLIQSAAACARDMGIDIKTGIYAYMPGPMFETPAEIRGLRALGADAVGMSTVPEVIAARHMGMKVLGISCITNMASGILGRQLTHEEVTRTANSAGKIFAGLVRAVIGGWRI
jgi:purine-nucleoside phosphorylase